MALAVAADRVAGADALRRCVLALGSISDRMDKGLSQQSRDFIAGDRVLRSAHPVPEGWLLDAQQQGLKVSRQLSFTTMTYAGDRPQLADVKATDLAIRCTASWKRARPTSNPNRAACWWRRVCWRC